MARRGFFGYDPYGYDDYYYPSAASAYSSYPYYHLPTAADAFFPNAAEPVVEPLFYPGRRRTASAWSAPARNHDVFPNAAPRTASAGSPKKSPPASFPVEVVTGPDPPAPKRPAPSAEEAALRLQAAVRGHAARKMVREVRAVEREAEAVASRVAAQADALRGDARARVGVGEELMRLLLRLDGVRGAREYRRRVTKRVLALQDAVDALDATPPAMVVTDAPEAEDAEEEADEMAPELQVESCTVASDPPAAETDTAMEVDGVSPVLPGGEADQSESELVAGDGEWEMVATGDGDVSTGEEEEDPVPAKPHQQEPAGDEKKTEVAAADTKRLMDMVAALCERSAQQCELIGALAERVDTLERAVRRVEEADRRRRRTKKINKETKKTIKSFYSD